MKIDVTEFLKEKGLIDKDMSVFKIIKGDKEIILNDLMVEFAEKANTPPEFDHKIEHHLSPKEKKELEKFKKQVKDLHGEYGSFTYMLTPTGIGYGITIRSELAKVERDITDYKAW